MRTPGPGWSGLAATAIVVAAAVVASATIAGARQVTVKMALDHELVRQALLAQIYTGPGETAPIWDDGTGCNRLVLADPRVDTREGEVRVETSGEARGALPLWGRCLFQLDWNGAVEIFEAPELDPAAPVVRFRVVDSNLYGSERQKQLATGIVWDWVKQYVQPRFAALRIDLGAPVRELGALLSDFLPNQDAERARRLLGSLELTDVQATEGGIDVRLGFDVEELPARVAASPAPEPEAPLSDAELAALEAALGRFDAFLTFVVKQAGADTPLAVLRAALLEVLLEERYDLLDALASPHRGTPDPVRELFSKSWARLAPVVRRLSPTLPGALAVRYLSFVSAGDALRALDEMGPASGLEITADGLRRLARLIAPAAAADPLAYGLEIDPELRSLFGFGAPLPAAEDNPEVARRRWPAFALGPAIAWAAGAETGGIDDDAVRRLNRWAPTRAHLDQYLPLVRDLLGDVAEERLRDDALAPPFQPLFRRLVPTTAWQESCWRQFVRQGGKLVPLRSHLGSIGMMQVNQNVWRGFYDLNGLRQDIRYNARAGSEILSQYLRRYAIVGGGPGGEADVEDLASAAYAVYNGGPGQLRRFREHRTSARERAVDRAFRDKLAKLRDGDALAVAECFGS